MSSAVPTEVGRDFVRALIDRVIAEMQTDYVAADGRFRFLTERDFHCELYARLRQELYCDCSGWRAHPVWLHAELPMGFESAIPSRYGTNFPDLSLSYQKNLERLNGRDRRWRYPPEAFIAHLELKYAENESAETQLALAWDWIKLRLLVYDSRSLCKPAAKKQREALAKQLVVCNEAACRTVINEVLAPDAILEETFAAGYLVCFSLTGPNRQPCRGLLDKLDRLDPNIRVCYCPSEACARRKTRR